MEIRARHVEITDTIRAYVERRLSFALDRFAERIRVARLTVEDVNSSRGGIDKHCLLAVSFTYSSQVTLESRALTVEGAIDRISSKLGSLIGRHVGRDRKRRRLRRSIRKLFETPSFSVRNFSREGTWS
jgi:ribosome-associated translation inhibitor RaiA